jgi:hypothetical protein
MMISSLFYLDICSTNSSSDPTPLDTEQVTFTNITYDAGLQGVGGQFLAWGDYNNDGYQDLLVNGQRLFRNNGPPNWDFTELTSQAGITGGSYGTWADWNNDGYLDFFTAGADSLWKNNGPPNWDFTDVTTQAGILRESHSTGSGWGDYDNDGDLDLFKIRGEDGSTGQYFPNSFWRNNGNSTFTNVTVEAGVEEYSNPKYSRGVAWADYNDDGWLDVYISNYRQLPNYLYENNGDGTFTDVASEKGVADGPPYGEGGNLDPYNRAGHGVGSVWGDYDNDGYLDLWVTNLNHKDWRTSDDSLLYHNDGPPDYYFTNMRGSSGIPVKPYVAPNEGDELFVGCAWGDYDNDGDLDLYLPQIYDIDYAYSFLYSNNGDGTFTDVTLETGVRVWDTYAGCWCDYDNDGDLDLLTSGRDSGGNGDPHFVHLFRNEGNSNNWLHLDIRGNGGVTNKAGIGVRVKISSENLDSQIKEVEGGMGPHGMQNSLILEFGLGEYTGTLDVEVTWTSGISQILHNIEVNQLVTIEEPLPDLEVGHIGVWNDDPITGETVDIQTVIENMGESVAKSALVKFYLGPPSNNVLISDPILIEDLFPEWGYAVGCDWNTSGYIGSYTIYCTVEGTVPSEDNLSNNVGWTDVNVRTHNELPVAILKVPPDGADIHEVITFDGSDSKDDTDILRYFFDFGDGVNSGWIYDSEATHTYSEGGIFTASLKVRDEDGSESINTAESVIQVRAKPHAVLSAIPTSIYKGESVTFNASQSSDSGGTIEKYYFDFGDGLISGWKSQAIVTHTYNSVGTFNASLKVRDNDGDTSTNKAEIVITVSERPNQIPIATVESISPNPATFGKDVIFSGYGEDEDGDIIAYHWSSDIDGDLSTFQIFSISSLSIGTHTISFKVQDDEELWSSEVFMTLIVKAKNEKPSIALTTPKDNEKVMGVITITGTAMDPDGDIQEVEIKIDDGRWETANGDEAWSYELDTTLFVDGEHTITIRAFDGEDYSDEFSTSIMIGEVEDEKLSPWLIFALVLVVAVVVIVLALAMGRFSKKKESSYQHPPQIQYSEEVQTEGQSPGTRWSW